MHSHLAAAWNRISACTGCSFLLAFAAGIVVVDATLGLSDVGLLVAVAVLVPLYEQLGRRGDAVEDGACCERC